uniref:peptidoglycan D,D-transpeptidase FtsI family protein n=1 Tax=Candidatus Enterococcus willemsii TaxID=1857215 RepID=UPI00403F3249
MQKFKKQQNPPHNKSYRKSHVPFRLNLLFFVIFGLFVALIIQLGSLQIVNTQAMEKQLKASSVIKIQGSTPRGIIYDASGKALVENKANTAITFTRGLEMTANDLLTIAEKLNSYIHIEADDNLTERDLKDYWLADKDHLDEARERLKKVKSIDKDKSEYEQLVDTVTADEINYSGEDRKIATIFKRLNSAQQLKTVFIKNSGVTDEEVAIVAEHAKELPGVSTGMDWTREIDTKIDGLQSIIGRVSKEGLQADNAEEYLEKGYALDDRVGTSFLEKQYEEVLQGEKSQQEITLNNAGKIEKQEEVFPGEKGDNLVLSINAEFQKKVDDILKNTFENMISNGTAEYSPGIYAVAMNPNTGEILAMSGYSHDLETNKLTDNTLGVYQNAFEPGSVMKAATLTAGWENGVLKGNEVLYDQPIYLQGSTKASIFNKFGENNRNLSAVQSLELSSNSYMIQIALRLMGIDYQGQTFGMPSVTQQEEVYKKLRGAMASYGMGTKTGIDLPNEAIGYQPAVSDLSDANNDAAKILDLAFGQFDTYTTMQLAQYVATVANGGKRMEPHLVSGIYKNDKNGNLGELKEKIEPKVLNEVGLSTEEMNILQEGFYQVVHGTDGYTTGRPLLNAKMDLAAKTGTAESVIINKDGKTVDVDNLNMVSYGPANDPQIALAVMVPQVSGQQRGTPNYDATRQIMDAYYDTFMAN